VHQNILKRQIGREFLSDIEKLDKTVHSFCQFIRELPEAALVEQAWGPREVLAHLVFWHELYASEFEARTTDTLFWGPTDTPTAINTMAVGANRSISVDELLRRFQVANGRLLHFGRTLDPQTIVW
jgi:hypothetical protein